MSQFRTIDIIVTPNETELFSALRAHYGRNSHAVFPQVRSSTGYGAARTADAIVMSLWPSRGLELIGVEFKSNRRDWLRELKDPEKAEEIFQFCDRWYLLAAKDVAKEDEVPDTWGFMLRSGRGIRVVRKAPKLEPQSVDRPFLAALLRNAERTFISDANLRQEYKKGWENGKKDVESDVNRAKEKASSLREAIKEFEEASGVKIHSWEGDEIGAAVRVVMKEQDVVERTLRRLESSARTLRSEADVMEKLIAQVKKEMVDEGK